MKFRTSVAIPKVEFDALVSTACNAIANVLWNEDNKAEFLLTPDQSEQLGEIRTRLEHDLNWFVYEKDYEVTSE